MLTNSASYPAQCLGTGQIFRILLQENVGQFHPQNTRSLLHLQSRTRTEMNCRVGGGGRGEGNEAPVAVE